MYEIQLSYPKENRVSNCYFIIGIITLTLFILIILCLFQKNKKKNNQEEKTLTLLYQTNNFEKILKQNQKFFN